VNRGRPATRQRELLAYVKAVVGRDGVAPSYGMICSDLGIRTRQEVSRIVSRLESMGELSRVGRGKVRRIRLPNYANL
jgi:SOS-response transcriptional repressor LexA